MNFIVMLFYFVVYAMIVLTSVWIYEKIRVR